MRQFQTVLVFVCITTRVLHKSVRPDGEIQVWPGTPHQDTGHTADTAFTIGFNTFKSIAKTNWTYYGVSFYILETMILF